MDAFQADPAAAVAGQAKADQAEIQDLRHPGRVQDRDHGVDQRKFALMGGGRGLAGVIVAHQHQHPAQRRAAGEIGVAEHVAGAIDARAFAVPHAEDAIAAAFAHEVALLGAPQGGRRHVLVDRRPGQDALGLEQMAGLAQLLIEAAERRAAIAGNVAAGGEAGGPVARLLQQRQTHQGLDPGQEDPAIGLRVLVLEGDLGKRQGSALPGRPRRATGRGSCPVKVASRAGASRATVPPTRRQWDRRGYGLRRTAAGPTIMLAWARKCWWPDWSAREVSRRRARRHRIAGPPSASARLPDAGPALLEGENLLAGDRLRNAEPQSCGHAGRRAVTRSHETIRHAGAARRRVRWPVTLVG